MSLEQRVDRLEGQMGHMEDRLKEHAEQSLQTQKLILSQLQANTDLTQQVASSTAGLRELWSQGENALKLFNGIMWIVKKFFWLVVIVLFLVVVLPYSYTHNGELPTWFKSLIHFL